MSAHASCQTITTNRVNEVHQIFHAGSVTEHFCEHSRGSLRGHGQSSVFYPTIICDHKKTTDQQSIHYESNLTVK